MKVDYTNEQGLSLPITLWLLHSDSDTTHKEYDSSGDKVISVTSLLKPTRMIYYDIKYKDMTVVRDLTELINGKIGGAIHKSLEDALSNKEQLLATLKELGYEESVLDKLRVNEEKVNDDDIMIYTEKSSMVNDLEIIGVKDWKITGRFDLVINGHIHDYKTTTVSSYMNELNKEDHIMQLSLYRLLNSDIIDKGTGYIHYILRDWKKHSYSKDYPRASIVTEVVKLHSINTTKDYVFNKINEVDKALKSDNPPDCSDEELWKEPDKFAYYKNDKNIRATKVFDDYESAVEMMKDNDKGRVEIRKGIVKRCDYCPYKSICDQYERLSK